MIGIKPASVLALVAVTLLAAPSLRAEDRMRPGLWEVVSTLDGKPSGAPHSTCYTPAMVEIANMPVKALREATEKAVTKGGLCTMKDFKMDGNTISMTQFCGSKSSAITSTYSQDSFDTLFTSTEGGVATVVHMKGRRLGACK